MERVSIYSIYWTARGHSVGPTGTGPSYICIVAQIRRGISLAVRRRHRRSQNIALGELVVTSGLILRQTGAL